MVNLKKEENKRKPISLIKPQTNRNINNTTNNIVCENLLSEFEPRTKHPVYTKNQFEDLNKQRVKYKDPEKFDAIPAPPPQNLNCPAVPQMQHLPQHNQNAKKQLRPDASQLMEMARIRNNQIQNNQAHNDNNLFNNPSDFQIILTILIMIILFMVLFPLFKNGMIFPVILVISPFVKIIACRDNTKHK